MALSQSPGRRRLILLAMAAFVLVGTALRAAQSPAPQAPVKDPATGPEVFETRIRPLLASNCFACHTQSAMGGLRVDSRDALLKGGDTGPAIVPGDPDKSTLLK